MNKSNQARRPNNSSLFGLLIILFGILLLIDNVIPGLHFFNRLFSWPIILIAVGFFIGHRSGYEKPAPVILIVTGSFFLILNLFHINFNMLFWPIILIALGFSLITGRSRKKRFHTDPTPPPNNPIWDKRVYDEKDINPAANASTEYTDFTDIPKAEKDASHDESTGQQNFHNTNQSNGEPDDTKTGNNNIRDEYVDSTSVFSSNKINVVSRNFKGGNVVNIFGGTEINLMHADMGEPAELEVIQLFGGSTIIAPAHWVIQPEMAAIFGGIEDKRFTHSIPDNSKILYIRGTSLFGGITIKSS